MMKVITASLLIVLLVILPLLYLIGNPILFPKSNAVDIPVQKDRLIKDVTFMAEIDPPRNHQNIVSLNTVADYIQKEFEQLEMETSIQTFIAEGAEYKNVIASIGTEHSSRIVIGAHYDVCGDQAGADDNASAVAGLLEVARLVHELKPELKHRIDFVAYTLEEPPFYNTEFMGSAVHARSLKEQNVDVEVMICLEMIGYFSDEENSQDYPISPLKWFYPTTGNFIAVIGKLGQNKPVRKVKKSMQSVADIDVRSINAPKIVQGIDFSDHRSYWAQGYDAVMVNNTAFYRNKNYHQKTDTVDSLNFNKMAEVVKGVYWALINY